MKLLSIPAEFVLLQLLPILIDAVASAVVMQPQCGKQLTRRSRIIGGEDAYDGEFPFLVSLWGPEEPRASTLVHKCGAALLSRRWVLTAAHCVNEYRRRGLAILKARFGVYDVKSDVSSHQPQVIGIESLVLHPNYTDPNRHSNDIALLHLKEDVVFDEYVWPVCLPDAKMNIFGMQATVAGWGIIQIMANGAVISASKLQKVEVPVLTNNACKLMFQEVGQRFPLEENQICAGYREGGKDSCQGDSGGPLFVKLNGQFTVIGVVSTGVYCGEPLLPGIYTRITSHLEWISREISRR